MSKLIKRKSEMAVPQRKNTEGTGTMYPFTDEHYVPVFKTQVAVN